MNKKGDVILALLYALMWALIFIFIIVAGVQYEKTKPMRDEIERLEEQRFWQEEQLDKIERVKKTNTNDKI